MRCFPYRKSLELLLTQEITLSEHGLGSAQHDPHPRFLALVGMVMRTGSEKDKRTMVSILRRQSKASTNNGRQNANVPKPKEGEGRTKVFPGGDKSSNGTPASANSGQYTMILKELGDESGVAPNYSLETLSLDPPMFKAVVSFRDTTFESTARTKKEAKHQASRQACEHLGFKGV
jgi:Double-stranded RNA binding motif